MRFLKENVSAKIPTFGAEYAVIDTDTGEESLCDVFDLSPDILGVMSYKGVFILQGCNLDAAYLSPLIKFDKVLYDEGVPQDDVLWTKDLGIVMLGGIPFNVYKFIHDCFINRDGGSLDYYDGNIEISVGNMTFVYKVLDKAKFDRRILKYKMLCNVG